MKVKTIVIAQPRRHMRSRCSVKRWTCRCRRRRAGCARGVAATRGGTIGVIGTAGTIKSGVRAAIRALESDVAIVAKACPLLVPLVEEGWMDHDATRLIIREYLEPMIAADVDTLVLGCTHYPLLKSLLADVLGPDVRLIDSAEETAAETGRTLIASELATTADADPTYRFIAPTTRCNSSS
jgi:glutamate racemase